MNISVFLQNLGVLLEGCNWPKNQSFLNQVFDVIGEKASTKKSAGATFFPKMYLWINDS